MVDILEKVAEQDEKKTEISLMEIEKSFDNIIKNPEDENKLIIALEKNVIKEKYAFEYSDIKNQIVQSDIDLSELSENTIKVYQLCDRLEGLKISPEAKKREKKKLIKAGRETHKRI